MRRRWSARAFLSLSLSLSLSHTHTHKHTHTHTHTHTYTHSLHQSQADLHDMHVYAGLLETRVRDEQTRVRELEGDIHISAETRVRDEQARQLSETQLFKDNQSLFRDNSKMLEDIKGMARELELGNQAIRSLENEVRALKRQTVESQELEDGYPSTLCLRYASSC